MPTTKPLTPVPGSLQPMPASWAKPGHSTRAQARLRRPECHPHLSTHLLPREGLLDELSLQFLREEGGLGIQLADPLGLKDVHVDLHQ